MASTPCSNLHFNGEVESSHGAHQNLRDSQNGGGIIWGIDGGINLGSGEGFSSKKSKDFITSDKLKMPKLPKMDVHITSNIKLVLKI